MISRCSHTYSLLAVFILTAAAFAQPAADPYTEILRYEYGQPRTATMAIEAEIHAASPEQLRAMEDKLLAILQSSTASTDAKDFACRQLRQAGSEESAAILAKLLADPKLETTARWALQSIPGAKVDAALRDALAKVAGNAKAGVLQTIGSRRDRAAVPSVAPLASDANPAIAEAALFALGHIGGVDALAAVQQATVPDSLKRYRHHAMLLCAERLAIDGQVAEAAAAYRSAFDGCGGDMVIKTGALRGILLAETDKAKAANAAVSALQDANADLRLSAAKLVCESGCPKLIGAVLPALSTLPADAQAAMLGLVNDPAAVSVVLAAAKSDDEGVRAAALGALGRLGDASSVALLLQIAAAAGGAEQSAARQSLQQLRGAEVDTALVAAAERGEPAQRAEAIRTLAARGTASAAALLLKTARDESEPVRIESFAGLAVLAPSEALPDLVKLLTQAPSAAERGAAEKATLAACQRVQDRDAAASTVSAALTGAGTDVRIALLRVLAGVPSDRSLQALRAARRDADAAVKDAAIRGLAEWPDARAIADMPEIAREADGLVHKVLTLRGLVRMAALPSSRPAAQTAKLLGDALSLAPRIEEKKAILAAVGDVPDVAALNLACGCLSDKELEIEAAMSVVKIARKVHGSNPDAAKAAVEKIAAVCTQPAARQLAEGALIIVGSMENIAPQGTASSPDDLDKDGTAGDDQAAIDGNPGTYWDEQDGKSLYRLVVTFRQPEKIAALSLQGYDHHKFAPRDFEVLCDGRSVKKIENAQYEDNLLVIKLDEVTCTAVELKITGYYGQSPAVRELGLYRPR